MEINNMEIIIDKQTIDKITNELSKDDENKIRAGYLTGRTEPGKIIVEGVYVPKQISDKISTTISSDEGSRAFANIKNQGKSGVGLVQYNGSFPVDESDTIRKSREQFPKRKEVPNLGLIVNQERYHKIFQYVFSF